MEKNKLSLLNKAAYYLQFYKQQSRNFNEIEQYRK